MVEFHTRRLQDAEHLDRHFRRLGLEQRVGRDSLQPRAGVGEPRASGDAVERRESGERFVEFLERLVFG